MNLICSIEPNQRRATCNYNENAKLQSFYDSKCKAVIIMNMREEYFHGELNSYMQME